MENSNPIDSLVPANIAGEIDSLKSVVKGLADKLVMFCEATTNALANTRPAPATVEAPAVAQEAPAPAQRRTRGPGRRTQAEAITNRVARAAAKKIDGKELHPYAQQALEIISAEKRIRGTDLAERMGIKRSLAYHHMGELVRSGKAVDIVRWVKGADGGFRKNHVFYRPDQVKTSDS